MSCVNTFYNLPPNMQMHLLEQGVNPVALGCKGSTGPVGPLGYCKTVPPQPAKKAAVTKEAPMRAIYAEETISVSRTDTTISKNYLVDRLDAVRYEHDAKFRKEFHIDAPQGPKTLTEALELIKAGKFTAPTKEVDDAKAKTAWDYRWYRQIDWRDPSEAKDQDGYDKATEAMDKARRDTRDAIMALTPKEGLDALNAFKAMTFH